MKRPLEFHSLPFYTQMYIQWIEDKLKEGKEKIETLTKKTK